MGDVGKMQAPPRKLPKTTQKAPKKIIGNHKENEEFGRNSIGSSALVY